jgi:MFS family permease
LLKNITGLFYGWRMVAASCALRVLGAGLHSFGFTVFFLPLSQDFNLNRTSTSLAFSLARAEGAIEGPIVGHLLDRYGPKPIMLAAVLLMGVGYLLFSQVNSYATFLLVYLGVISLAHAGGFMHAPMVLINTWFIRHRARAITVSSAAFGLGGVLVAPVLSIIVQTWGWRWGAAIAGMFFLVMGIPLALTIRRSPESMGLLPDGDEPVSPAPGARRRWSRGHQQSRRRCHRGRGAAVVRLLGIGTGGGYSQRFLPCDRRTFHTIDGLERTEPSGGCVAAERLCFSRHGRDALVRLVCRQD